MLEDCLFFFVLRKTRIREKNEYIMNFFLQWVQNYGYDIGIMGKTIKE